jgi:ferredoxin
MNMFGLDLFNKVMKMQLPQIKSKQCIKLRNHRSECAKCIQGCPQGALSFHEELLLKEANCSGCGVCLASCPVGVFTLPGFSEKKILQAVEGASRKLISCTKSNLQTGYVKINCLGQLSTSMLISILLLSQGREMLLNIAPCQGCSDANIISELKERIAEAVGICTGLGQAGRITMVTNPEELPKEDEEAFSRRELFSLLKKQTAATGLQVASLLLEEDEREEGTFTKETPKDRRLLLKLLREKVKSSEIDSSRRVEGIGVKWKLTDSCQACGACARVCPTGAMNIAELDDGQVELSQQLGACSGCNLCQELCLNQGRTAAAQVAISELINQEPVVIGRVSRGKCVKCGDYAISINNDNVFCPACEKKEEISKDLFSL